MIEPPNFVLYKKGRGLQKAKGGKANKFELFRLYTHI